MRIKKFVLSAISIGCFCSTAMANLDPMAELLVGHWQLNEKVDVAGQPQLTNVVDESTYQNHGTLVGSQFQSLTAPNGLGLDFKAENSGEYLDLGSNASLNIGTVHTIMAWIRVQKDDGMLLTTKSVEGDINDAAIHLKDGRLIYTAGSSAGGAGLSASVEWNYQIPFTKYHHVAIVRNNTGVTFYVDGVQQGVAQGLGGNPAVRYDRMGGLQGNTAHDWEGVADDVRIYTNSINQQMVAQYYKASSMVGHWTFDNDSSQINDVSDYQNNGTVSGIGSAPSDVQFSANGHIDKALKFGGADSYVDLGDDSSLDLGTEHTLSAWVKVNSDNRILLGSKPTSGLDMDYAFYINKGEIYYKVGSGPTPADHGDMVKVAWDHDFTQPMTEFRHIAIVRSGNAVVFYVDGIQQGDKQCLKGLDASGEHCLVDGEQADAARFDWLGGGTHESEFDWDGTVDDLKMITRALSPGEIANLANGLVAHWSLDQGAGKLAYSDINTAQGSNGRLLGDTKWVEGQSGTALSFDGAGDYVDLSANNTDLNLGKVHTVAAWIKPTNDGGILLGAKPQTGMNGDYAIFLNGGRLYYRAGSGPSPNNHGHYVSVEWGYAQNTTEFHHVAITRSGENVTFYVDGNIQGTVQTLGGNPDARFDWLGGATHTSEFDYTGAADDIRLYNTALSATKIQTLAQQIAPQTNANKVLYWGPDTAQISNVLNNIGAYEQWLDVDGLILQNLTTTRNDETVQFDTVVFEDHAFTYEQFIAPDPQSPNYEPTKYDMMSIINFQRYTDNFLRIKLSPQTPENRVDWFEYNDNIRNNVKLAAQLVKDAGFKGLMIDTEDYTNRLIKSPECSGGAAIDITQCTGSIFEYPRQKNANSKTFEQYQQEVRNRGEWVMDALEEGYADITVIFTIGYGYATHTLGDPANMPTAKYGLLPAFIDGMVASAGPSVTLVDGNENGFDNSTAANMLEDGELNRINAVEFVAPDLVSDYYQKMKTGMGVYPNHTLLNLPGLTSAERLSMWKEITYSTVAATSAYSWIYADKFSWLEPIAPGLANTPNGQCYDRDDEGTIIRHCWATKAQADAIKIGRDKVNAGQPLN